jgi:hypothetical protein
VEYRRCPARPGHDEKGSIPADLMTEAGTQAEFWRLADVLLDFGYVPRGRFAATPTYLFAAADRTERMRRLLAARS